MILTKEFTFDCAHSLTNYDGECKNIHGHTYRLKVFIKGNPVLNDREKKGGMIYDFSEIKKIINNYILERYDHSLITTKKELFFKKLPEDTKYGYLNYPFNIKTTCEMISLQILNDLVKLHIPINAIELWETPTSSCYTTREDLNEYIEQINK